MTLPLGTRHNRWIVHQFGSQPAFIDCLPRRVTLHGRGRRCRTIRITPLYLIQRIP